MKTSGWFFVLYKNASANGDFPYVFFKNQKNSRRLELSISKNSPPGRWGQGPGQCRPKVPGRFAFPSARDPRICSISRFGKIIPAVFPGLSRSFSREPPNASHKQAKPLSSFLNKEEQDPHGRNPCDTSSAVKIACEWGDVRFWCTQIYLYSNCLGNWVSYWRPCRENGEQFQQMVMCNMPSQQKCLLAGLLVLGNLFLPGKQLPGRNLFSRNYFGL